ncbi:expressed unknown protein [Seminavis robusta]|uniref:Uncharacterized protein n=1 Tax=Seminavis robusta TaxID=568900 RepID=A0A9N8EHI6_9STRA|nr:expressed unknown protein [Seminavis robusta]|eukprot:Sro1220_g253510.1 n/a (811) ;mRNA; r:7010-9538
MASHEHLDQLANSPSTTSDEEEDGHEDAATVVEASTMSVEHDDDDPMAVDSPTSATKPRLKLKIRASITSTGSSDHAALNGITAERDRNGGDENEKPPSTLHIVKNSPPSVTPVAVAVGMEDEEDDNEEKPVVKASTAVKKKTPKDTNGEKKGKAKSPNGEKKKKKVKSTAAKSKAVKSESKTASTSKATSSSKAGKTSKTKSEDGVKKVKKKVKKEPPVNGASTPTPLATGPPKKKKKLPKLPLGAKRKLPTKANSPATVPPEPAEATVTVSATVVASDDEVVDADAVATVVVEAPAKPPAPAKAPAATKRKAVQAKAIRLPPMTSPGLMIRGNNTTEYTTPQSVFEGSMAAAGYTTEGRTNDPHRGSSVKRVVGDMFDSNVAFALNFPTIAPTDIWTTERANVLLKSLGNSEQKKESAGTSEENTERKRENGSRKRPRTLQVSEMLPVSLTLPYPESYIEQGLQYVKEVQERETAIVQRQEMQEKLETEQDEKDIKAGKMPEDASEPRKMDNPVNIPPIPVPPAAPPLSQFDFKGIDADQYEGTHPIYLPKGKKNFVAHLDKDCFHATEGRYFGLSSNFIADPHFVGPSAPGLAGLTLSVGSGLATTSTTSGNNAASSVLAAPPPIQAAKSSTGGNTSSEKAPKKEASSTTGTTKTAKKTASLPTVAKAGPKSKFKLKHAGPAPTATTADLRKVMEGSEGKEMAEETRRCIIRAAVHASRSGKHGQAFLAPDGKAYPDVSKAFAAHAGLKPCSRCKNNKQGAYHCRLRRKHKELDYDGGDSPAELSPLLMYPLEELLLNPATLRYGSK